MGKVHIADKASLTAFYYEESHKEIGLKYK